VLGDGTAPKKGSNGCMLMRQAVERAGTPSSLRLVLGGPFAIAEFRKKIRAISVSKQQKGGHMVDFDDAMMLAFELWRFADSLRDVREKLALRTLQRFMKRRHERLHRMAKEENNQGKPHISLTTRSSEENSGQLGARGEAAAVSKMTTPSPRMAEKLDSARQLDSQLNPAHAKLTRSSPGTAAPSATAGSARSAKALGAGESTPPPPAITAEKAPPPPERRSIHPPSQDNRPVKCDPEVEMLLRSLGLEKYAPGFAAEEVDMTALRLMSEYDLAEMNIAKGSRVKLRAALVRSH